MKLSLNARARIVAESYLTAVCVSSVIKSLRRLIENVVWVIACLLTL